MDEDAIKEKKYQKPTVITIEIPERTSYACSITGTNGCPDCSAIVGHNLCQTAEATSPFGLGGPC